MQVTYQTLEILQEHGIASNDIQKLMMAGYHTIESVRKTKLAHAIIIIIIIFY